jgi:hypothetical protein
MTLYTFAVRSRTKGYLQHIASALGHMTSATN